jgi:universal stress protein A
MKHYQHILVPLDFSEMGELVLEQAQATASLYNAGLTLLHVVQDVPPGVDAFGEASGLIMAGEVEQQLLENAREQMQRLAEKRGLPADAIRVELGITVTDSVLEVAEELGIDLIVIGHSGKKGFLGFLGSTATAVVKSAKCDVLVVRR